MSKTAGAIRLSGEDPWIEILGLDTGLLRVAPSPVIRLDRAIAVSKVHGPAAALALIDPLLGESVLSGHHLAHVAQAGMLRQPGQIPEALAACRRALALCKLEPERRLLLRRIEGFGGG